MERVSGEAGEKQQYCPGISDLLFGTIFCNLNGLWLHVKVLQVGERVGGDKEKRNVCLALFSLTISLPIWLRSFDLPTTHRDFKGTAGCRDALKRLFFEMKTMIINSLFQKLSQQQLYLTDWKLWRVCLKGLHGWVIKQLEVSLAESPLQCPTKPVEHYYTNRSPWKHA